MRRTKNLDPHPRLEDEARPLPDRREANPDAIRARFPDLDQTGDVAARAGAAGEYSVDLRIGELHVRAHHCRDWVAEVGRDGALVEARGREAQPLADGIVHMAPRCDTCATPG